MNIFTTSHIIHHFKFRPISNTATHFFFFFLILTREENWANMNAYSAKTSQGRGPITNGWPLSPARKPKCRRRWWKILAFAIDQLARAELRVRVALTPPTLRRSGPEALTNPTAGSAMAVEQGLELHMILAKRQRSDQHDSRENLPHFKMFTISYLYASFGQYINSVVLRC